MLHQHTFIVLVERLVIESEVPILTASRPIAQPAHMVGEGIALELRLHYDVESRRLGHHPERLGREVVQMLGPELVPLVRSIMEQPMKGFVQVRHLDHEGLRFGESPPQVRQMRPRCREMLDDMEEQDDLDCGGCLVQVIDGLPSCGPVGFAGTSAQVETRQVPQDPLSRLQEAAVAGAIIKDMGVLDPADVPAEQRETLVIPGALPPPSGFKITPIALSRVPLFRDMTAIIELHKAARGTTTNVEVCGISTDRSRQLQSRMAEPTG